LHEERVTKRAKLNEEPSSSPLTIAEVTNRLQQFLRENHTIICDTGDSWFTGTQLTLPSQAAFEGQFGYASIGMSWEYLARYTDKPLKALIGWSLPASFGYAIGAAPAQRRVINIIGDGKMRNLHLWYDLTFQL